MVSSRPQGFAGVSIQFRECISCDDNAARIGDGVPEVRWHLPKTMLYDVFICHASEDKEAFARPLATALRAANVAVWFDEFELKVGASLRQSIDLGLSKSRLGIVILSKALFGKGWPQWELDGLVQRHMASSDPVLLPIWLDVAHEDVMAFSPSLADKYALQGSLGVDQVVSELLRAIRPKGSSLVIARDRLIELGYSPPVVTDDWWHGVIEYCGSNDMEETFQEAMGWGHWGFPLPGPGETAEEKGGRIARAALQLNWQEHAEREKISQITHPDEVHRFLERMPGLQDACWIFPHFLAAYAPQLTIPGLGGEFEELFDHWLQSSLAEQEEKRARGATEGTALTVDGQVPTCDEPIALHDPAFGNYQPALMACYFVQGHIFGPPVKVYDTIDYVAWFLSTASDWMPDAVRAYLIEGLKAWPVWPWSDWKSESDFTGNAATGKLLDELYSHRSHKAFRLTKSVREDLRSRLEYATTLLRLPEGAAELSDRFLSAGFIEAFYAHRRAHPKKGPRRARTDEEL